MTREEQDMRRVIQILIVVLILLMCGGIVTLFVAKVHEAAARSQCINNLKQLGLAILNYHDTYAEFPQAAMPKPARWPDSRQSWIVAIVPFVEASPLYNKMDHEKAWDAEENRFAALLVVKFLQCPAYPERPPTSTFAPTHYIGMAGIGDRAIDLPLEDGRAGFFGYERTIKRADVEGRAGSLLMLIETSRASGAWTAAGPPTTRGLDPNRSPYIGSEGQFGGNHPHGANAVFADGSVRFIEQSIAPAALEAMATLSGKGNPE